jgi:endonuclease YncB( thermonuclease family)
MRYVLALFLLVSGPAVAVENLTPGPRAVVDTVVDGDTVVLSQPVDGADQVRLVGIQAPKLPLGRRGFRTWPLAAPAKAALEALILGRTVDLAFGGRRLDRHGRLLAHLYLADGTWIQGALLGQGMARVYSFADNRSLIPQMLAEERAARAAGRGIWGHPFYAVRDARVLDRHLSTFQLVEGRVAAAARVKGTVYLNFGDDWRTDFTVRLDSRARRLFRRLGVDPLSLEGRRVRVRGWLRRFNGPLIDATHPEQIEVLVD